MALRCRVTADYDCKVALIPAIDADVRNEDSNYDETFWLFEGEDANSLSLLHEAIAKAVTMVINILLVFIFLLF